MKSKTLREFRKELEESERFGTIAVRLTAEEALEKWGGDPEELPHLAELFLLGAEKSFRKT